MVLSDFQLISVIFRSFLPIFNVIMRENLMPFPFIVFTLLIKILATIFITLHFYLSRMNSLGDTTLKKRLAQPPSWVRDGIGYQVSALRVRRITHGRWNWLHISAGSYISEIKNKNKYRFLNIFCT